MEASAMKKEKILIYAALFIALIALFWSVMQLGAQGGASAIASELGDKCATPPGYTDEQWREHMGHHPDRYKECL